MLGRSAPETSSRRAEPARVISGLLDFPAAAEAAARQLDVSGRTYRRHVADILVRLGASSRFRAGVEAIRRGWR